MTTTAVVQTEETPEPAATPAAVATEAAIELAAAAGAATEAARNAEGDAARAQITAEAVDHRVSALEVTVAQGFESIRSELSTLGQRVTTSEALAISPPAETPVTTDEPEPDGAEPVVVDQTPPADVPPQRSAGGGLWALLLGRRNP